MKMEAEGERVVAVFNCDLISLKLLCRARRDAAFSLFCPLHA